MQQEPSIDLLFCLCQSLYKTPSELFNGLKGVGEFALLKVQHSVWLFICQEFRKHLNRHLRADATGLEKANAENKTLAWVRIGIIQRGLRF